MSDITPQSAPPANAAGSQSNTASADARQILLKEIGTKWNKFSEHELSEIKDKADLVDRVVAKYGLEKPQSQRDVDGLLKGRHF
jgi:hypothetical protein